MKRKLLLGILFCVPFILTGSFFDRPHTEEEIMSYLEERYPGEEFVIVGREETTISCHGHDGTYDSYITYDRLMERFMEES